MEGIPSIQSPSSIDGRYKIDFQTFLRTAREIFVEVGGEFSKDKLEQAIRRKKDHQKICADVIKKAIELETVDSHLDAYHDISPNPGSGTSR